MKQGVQWSSEYQVPSRIGLGKALEMFEEALTILDAHCGEAEGQSSLPSEPLPNMLERCEEALRNSKNSAPQARILCAFPGLPHLSSVWWQGRVGGVTCVGVGECLPGKSARHGLSGGARSRLALGAIEELQQELGRVGRSLLLTVTADGPELPLVPKRGAALLVCHPIASYQACLAAGEDLNFDEFCVGLNHFLAHHQDLPLLRSEDIETDREGLRDLCTPLHFTPSRYAVQDDGFIPDKEQRTFDCSDFLNVPAYRALCEKLGYPPERAYLLHRNRAGLSLQKQPSPEDGRALGLVSSFMERAIALFDALAPQGAQQPDTTQVLQKLDACLGGDEQDFLERLDETADGLGPQTASLLLLAAAAHYYNKKQPVHGMSFVAEALHRIPLHARWLRVLAASLLLELNRKNEALTTLLEDAILSSAPFGAGKDVLKAYLGSLGNEQKAGEHGHALLLDYLHRTPPLRSNRKRVLIEIGTTREVVPGQGSTEKLASFCAEYGVDFITVDMDERNTRMARRMFRRHGYTFQAVTAKGEDFLAQYEGSIDYVFLDAYDFDHGNHSEIRQGRYEKFLGARIDELQCHKMHLDCAETLVSKLTPDGVICFDDTWLDENEKWTAKGTTAMPYLLDNGFEVVSAGNRAALLRRHSEISR
ncbi:hypothetical protein [Phaeobacter gallaeciensis]|uniref:hypothetical protein n=1 Tax=Phaeobacter gallaeciensis TaxID=60890 RepID=UPI00237F1AAF|nr:hypothetical protein [Phaeobacter gallaeciensis]MDE4142360.1 hypothetical protein [Phaeobacter gallaeciensis]MDE4150805.1 hypothetical protein [Phaeobacter gallaeciensis]MDE4155034.1 hypothetical protein [Phaeobacter gallaeciensis]MDE4230424.1 hypothetical protein [Phaeobacter gallaeciensis]MDE4259501.1 hypothetical protein [Phaeobacter gallaeciensis]